MDYVGTAALGCPAERSSAGLKSSGNCGAVGVGSFINSCPVSDWERLPGERGELHSPGQPRAAVPTWAENSADCCYYLHYVSITASLVFFPTLMGSLIVGSPRK